MGKAINKVILGEKTLMDISEDTVSEDNLLEGATAHAADGTQITGKVVVAEIVDNLEDQSPDKALSANQGKVLKDYIYKHPYVSYDNKNPIEYDDQVLITKEQPLQNLLSYLTTAVKNIRYLFKMIGSTDISAIGDGTLTGGLSTLNSNLTRKPNYNGGFDLGAKSYTTTQDCYICVGSRHSGTNAYTEIYINGNFAYSNYLFSNGETIGFSHYLYVPKGSIISYDVNPIGDGIIYQTLFRIVPTV